MNDQLKKDIQEWQEKADNATLGDNTVSFFGLISEARTLLLRASESV